MKSQKTLFAASVVAAALLVIGFAGFSSVPPPGVEIGKPVPDFSLTGIDGKTYNLAQYKGEVVVLEWSNPNCPFVQRVYRESIMQDVQKKYKGKVVWLTINSTNPDHRDHETAKALEDKYNEWGASYTAYLLDPDGTVGRMYDAKTTPHMFVINKQGTLVYEGAIDNDPRGNKSEKTNYVDQALTELFGGKNIAVATTRSYGCSVKY